jgi:hypothetical protein
MRLDKLIIIISSRSGSSFLRHFLCSFNQIFNKKLQYFHMSIVTWIVKHSPKVAFFGNFFCHRIFFFKQKLFQIIYFPLSRTIVKSHFFGNGMQFGEVQFSSLVSKFVVVGRCKQVDWLGWNWGLLDFDLLKRRGEWRWRCCSRCRLRFTKHS